MLYKLKDNIKNLRLERGLNQVQFAKILGITKQCVSNWENDNVIPSVEMLEKLADFFMVTTDYLLGRCDSRLLDVTGLDDDQIGHISQLVNDLRKQNKKR